MNNFTIIPSGLKYKGAPSVDERVTISLNQQSQQITEYDRSVTISLAQVYDDERQSCTVFRPTFKVNYIYDNTYVGNTTYLPFQYNLYYVDAENSMVSGIWKGYPQYYEFDFFRPDVKDQHFNYKSKSAYTYNWMYYLTYPFENDYTKKLSYYTPENNQVPDFDWQAQEGIPFVIENIEINGNGLVSFKCIAPHGLSVDEYVELSLTYRNSNIFQVYSLGNGLFDSDPYVFNVFNIGYTGNTFADNVYGFFKRVINPDNLLETKSKYYVRKHKVITNLDDLIITKNGFEKNVFNEQKQFEYSSITPNQISRISQKTSSNSYNITSAYDLDFAGYKDNQMRPLSELYLTIINKGYSGYFNEPSFGYGLKEGWEFNLTEQLTDYWDLNNFESTCEDVSLSSYTLTSGSTKTFYYNQNLSKDDVLYGDFCEWNDYEQLERVISPYYQKINYNQKVFQTSDFVDTNSKGFYYAPHNKMTLKVFSDYIETGNVEFIDQLPEYSFYSESDQQFRWRDLYTYGFFDNFDRGVDYPFLNTSHYPFADIVFRLIPEGSNYNESLNGVDIPIKPLIDDCE
jgi:hypothetical protein